MKKSGRKCKYPKDIVERAVSDYLASELSLEEIASKYAISIGAINYQLSKKRKEQRE